MANLENIIVGAIVAAMGTTIFAGLPLAYGMSLYAESYNSEKREEFLKKEFGKENIPKINVGEPRYNPKRKGTLFLPVELNKQKYLMELEPKKSSLLADLFYDTRLYDPIGLIKQS